MLVVSPPRQLQGKMLGVLGASKFSLGKRFKFSLNTFTVVSASNLKALVCPFSKYSLSTLGIHSREFPWKTQVVLKLALPACEYDILRSPGPAWCGEQGPSSLTSSPCHGLILGVWRFLQWTRPKPHRRRRALCKG